MEKKEAIREWCIDTALKALAYKAGVTSEEAVKYAEELEKYITK